MRHSSIPQQQSAPPFNWQGGSNMHSLTVTSYLHGYAHGYAFYTPSIPPTAECTYIHKHLHTYVCVCISILYTNIYVYNIICNIYNIHILYNIYNIYNVYNIYIIYIILYIYLQIDTHIICMSPRSRKQLEPRLQERAKLIPTARRPVRRAPLLCLLAMMGFGFGF